MRGEEIKVLMSDLTRTEQHSLEVLLPRRLGRPVRFLGEEGGMPDLILFGIDGKQADARWSALKSRYPTVPTVYLSFSGKGFDTWPVVQRPAKIDVLIETVDRLLQDAPGRKTPQAARPRRAPLVPAAFQIFRLETKLIGILAQADRLARRSGADVIVEGMGRFLFLRDGRVFSTVGEQSLRSLCVPRLHPEAFTVRRAREQEVRGALDFVGTGGMWERENFLWRVAGYCSRGALPSQLREDEPLAIRRWPDAVRLPDPLLVTAISAVLARGNVSAREISERLGVSPEPVARYLTAAYVLGILEQGRQAAVRRGPEERNRPNGWSSGVLGKLARRVVGRLFQKAA